MILLFNTTIQKIKKISDRIRSDSFLLYLCFKDKRTPYSAKIISLIALALAFSPIDLIPDFIPVLGYLDDIIIIPLLVVVAFRLIPENIITENKKMAEKLRIKKRPVFKSSGLVIIVLWLLFLSYIIYRTFNYFKII